MEDRLMQRLEALERRVALLEDRAQIENLVARHNFYVSSGQGRRIVPELWTREEDASIEYGASGVYGARWKVITFYVSEELPGCLTTCAAMNQHLTVAEDGQSARGVWMTVGTETDAGDLGAAEPDAQRRVLFSSHTAAGEGYRAEVLLQRQEMRFVKEDGQWRIHDLHVGEFFRYPAGSDWVVFARERQVTDGMWLEAKFDTPDPIPSFENLPSGETTSHWQYDVDALPWQQETEALR